MKKIILIIAAMAMTTMAFAQKGPGSWTLTPSVGLTVANVTNSEGADPRIGLIAGGEALYQITDVIGISGGLYYAMEGVKAKEDGITETLANDYINIPILAQAYVAKGLAVKLGIQPAFLVSAKVKASVGGFDGSVDMKEMYNTFDLAMPIGLSYEYKNIVVDARYNLGFTNLLKDYPSSENGKNSVFQFMVGYRF